MTMNLASPVTGSAQTGLTSPTYTLVADIAPDASGRQFAVSALGGTQSGVDVSSISRPFTTSVFRPKVFKTLPSLLSNGRLPSVPSNSWKVISRKGVTVLAGQPSVVAIIRTTIDIPAGADVTDVASVRALLSLHFGSLAQLSAGIGDSMVSGIF